jgi:hypothetical protein
MNGFKRRSFLACIAWLLLAACTKQGQAPDPTLGYQLPAGESHLTFTFPALGPSGSFKGRPAVTMRIPREYVRFQTVLSKNGQIYQVPLQIELPGPTPWQDRSWLKGKKGTPEWDEFMKGWIGKFIVVVGTGSGLGGRGYFLNSINPKNVQRRTDMVADGEAYGLVRYSPKRCYTPEDLEQTHLKAFLDAKPTDDPAPEAHCRVDRRWAEYFSPLPIEESERVVSINCLQDTCNTSFDFEDIGATLYIRGPKLERWPEIVNPTRELLRSFIVRDALSNTWSPSPASPSSR